ncbi:decapping and exoribonuclease protein-like [Antedon mediterranea]|uniref:decapping and exoribonuclease protein-like n=1 Tax=Antedon mediterranea TaxID=105859 RepID=UPI003AF47141
MSLKVSLTCQYLVDIRQSRDAMPPVCLPSNQPRMSEGERPDTTIPINKAEAYYSVVRTKLRGHSLMYSAEVDCCETSDPELQPPFNYVEIKTNKIGRNKHKFVHPFKLLKWWAQSFLIGIPKIIAGFRSEHGIAEQADVETYLTCDIPKIANKTKLFWNPEGCMNFCDKFLKFVKDVVRRDDPKVVYLFERTPGGKTVTYREGKVDDIFVPDWYASEFVG